jgi:addiction module HigA family antidote
MNKKVNEPKTTVLTERMDFGTKGFHEFRSILMKKVQERTPEQVQELELLSIKYKMEDYLTSTDVEELSVGYFIQLILEKLGIKQYQFAEYLRMKPSNLNKVIKGERPINYDLALIFGRLFNNDPMLWIEIQAKSAMLKMEKTDQKRYSAHSLANLLEETKVKYGK